MYQKCPGKDKLNTIEVLISQVLINSYTIHDEFRSVNNVLRWLVGIKLRQFEHQKKGNILTKKRYIKAGSKKLHKNL